MSVMATHWLGARRCHFRNQKNCLIQNHSDVRRAVQHEHGAVVSHMKQKDAMYAHTE